MRMETTELCILIPVLMTVTISTVTVRNHFPPIFVQSSLLILMKFSMLPQPIDLSKLMLNSFCMIDSKRRELSVYIMLLNIPLTLACTGTHMNQFVSNLVRCSHDSTVQCDASLNYLDLHSRSQVPGKLEFVQSICYGMKQP